MAQPTPQAASAAAAQDSVQEGTPPGVLSPTSPAEPAKEGGGAATPGVVAGTPPVTAPAVPVPEGEPRLLRLDVSCLQGQGKSQRTGTNGGLPARLARCGASTRSHVGCGAAAR